MNGRLIAAAAILLALAASVATAQISLVERDATKLDLNMEINAATFGFTGSYFGNSVEFNGANTDTWSEGAFEAGLAFETALGKGAFFAELSALATRTWSDDASGFTVGLDRTQEVSLEQTHIGWRSGDAFPSLGKDALTVKIGSFDYLVGTGLQIADGASDGGGRGGWWMSVRKAFREAFLVTLKTGSWKAEVFTLKAENRFSTVQGRGAGFNVEYMIKPAGLNLGLMYFDVDDTEEEDPFEPYKSTSLRGDWTSSFGLGFSGELAIQDKDGTKPKGWFLNGSYGWHDTRLKPEISYRFARFSGDDLSTPGDEAFAMASYGFTDYGYWFQGEITGNYPLDNSNLKSHMFRFKLSATDDLVLNAIYYRFVLDQPNVFGDPVGSTDWGDEVNLAADWSLGDHIFLNGVFGVLFPGDAAKNWTGGDKDWVYGMAYFIYTF